MGTFIYTQSSKQPWGLVCPQLLQWTEINLAHQCNRDLNLSNSAPQSALVTTCLFYLFVENMYASGRRWFGEGEAWRSRKVLQHSRSLHQISTAFCSRTRLVLSSTVSFYPVGFSSRGGKKWKQGTHNIYNITHTHIYMHTYTHAWSPTHIHTHICVHMHTLMCMHTYVCTGKHHIHTQSHAYSHMHMHTHIGEHARAPTYTMYKGIN